MIKYSLPQKQMEKPVSVFGLLHKMIKKSLPKLHSKRVNALLCAAEALVNGKKLTLTGLARSSKNTCTPKSAIRKIDRLLGNSKIHNDRKYYYEYVSNSLLSGVKSPLISIDWSGSPRHNFYCIRASLNLKGRSLVLYEEVHPRKLEKNTKVNNNFLISLKNILPKNCKPIIITDAGFRTPWFNQILQLGWNFVGRVRNNNCYFDLKSNTWSTTYELYERATSKAKTIANILLTKRSKLACSLHYYRGKIKGRKNYNRSGKVSKRGHSKVCSKSYRDPLVMATSLDIKSYNAVKVISIYNRRMEIEEEFRDLKSRRYGFGMRESGTKSTTRLEVLLLIALLASFACWIVAIKLKNDKSHLKFQANTEKNINVLSIQYLACEAFRWFGDKLNILKQDFNESLKLMRCICSVGPNG